MSPNGQISGFTEYAGLDVLVILPGGRTPVVKRDTADVLAEAESLVRERMELAFRQYKELRNRFPTPEAAARAFLQHVKGLRIPGLLGRADAWIRDQMGSNGGGKTRKRRAKTAAKGRTP